MPLRRLAGFVALTFGAAGVAICLAGAYGVWRAKSALDRANDRALEAIDQGLTAVRDRVPDTQERVRQSRITTEEVTTAVRAWAATEARSRALDALQVEVRTVTLTRHLEAVDARLNSSAMALGDLRRLLELAESLGAQVDPAMTDPAALRLTALREKVDEAVQSLDEVRRYVATADESPTRRIAQVMNILARIALTLADVETRLADFAVWLGELRSQARQLHQRTGRHILLGAIACFAVLAWIAAGQLALARWGWTRCRRAGAVHNSTPKSG